MELDLGHVPEELLRLSIHGRFWHGADETGTGRLGSFRDNLEVVVYTPEWQSFHRLKDGTVAVLRLVRPSDKPLFRQAAAEMSAETMASRFFSPKPRFSDSELTYLTEVDAIDHLAVVALRRRSRAGDRPVGDETTDWQGIGAARFIRHQDDPTIAEFAVLVHDQCQNAGLGRELLHHLAQAAQERGIKRFKGDILATNTAAFRLIDSVAPGAEWLTNGIIAIVEWDLRHSR